MWECPKCGHQVEDSSTTCWCCDASKPKTQLVPINFVRVFSVIWFSMCGLFVVGGLAFLGFAVVMSDAFDSPLERIGFATFSMFLIGMAFAFILIGKRVFAPFWKAKGSSDFRMAPMNVTDEEALRAAAEDVDDTPESFEVSNASHDASGNITLQFNVEEGDVFHFETTFSTQRGRPSQYNSCRQSHGFCHSHRRLPRPEPHHSE